MGGREWGRGGAAGIPSRINNENLPRRGIRGSGAGRGGVFGKVGYTTDHMSRYTLQTAAFLKNIRPVIWLDVEKRTADPEPALTSVLWAEGLKTYAHDAILAASAKARGLEFLPWLELAMEVVRIAQTTNSLIAGYSIPERDLLMKACPEQAEWIKSNYLNANAAKWFKNHRPNLYAEACRTAGERRKPGLKDFLIQPAIGYSYKKYLLGVQPGSILGRLRALLTKRGGVHRELTNEARRDWTNLIEYNRQDVLGMKHLVEYVVAAGADSRAG